MGKKTNKASGAFKADPSLLKQVREMSDATGISMKRIIEDGISLRLKQLEAAK